MYMKRLLFSILLLLMGWITTGNAAPITPLEAEAIAKIYFSQNGLRSNLPIRLTYTHYLKGENRLRNGALQENNLVGYYIFNRGEREGFAIVAGDDRLYPLLAYSDSGYFDLENAPEQIRYWMAGYEQSILQMLSQPEIVPVGASPSRGTKEVLPLLDKKKILWDQEYPYNLQCPFEGNIQCPTGCVATAMAQILRFHEWPNAAVGSHSYTDNGISRSVQYGHEYNWADMPGTFSKTHPDAEKHAKELSRFMKDVGFGVDMSYGASGSGAFETGVVRALREHFKYKKSVTTLFRYNYTATEWENLIREELDAERPVLLSGYGEGGGHAFVCDGYNKEGFFHINWGWSGIANGYFRITALDPAQLGTGAGLGGYNYGQSIIINIIPDRDNNPGLAPALEQPTSTIRGVISEDKTTIKLHGYLYQRFIYEAFGKVRFAFYKNNQLASGVEALDLKLTRGNPMSLKGDFKNVTSQGIQLEDGDYVGRFEWKHNGASSFEKCLLFYDEPSELYFTVKDGKFTSVSYDIGAGKIEIIKNSTTCDLFAYARSKVSFKVKNNSTREYYGPAYLYCLRDKYQGNAAFVPRDADPIAESKIAVLKPNEETTLTFDNFFINEKEGTKMNLYIRFADIDLKVPTEDFIYLSDRSTVSWANSVAMLQKVKTPTAYTDPVLLISPLEEDIRMNLANDNVKGPKFQIENKGTRFSAMLPNGIVIGIVGVAYASDGGTDRLVAVSSEYYSDPIASNTKVEFRPIFSTGPFNPRFKQATGKDGIVKLRTLYVTQEGVPVGYADKREPLFGTPLTKVSYYTDHTTGIETPTTSANEISIYPNPIADRVEIQALSKIYAIEVWSIEGVRLQEYIFQGLNNHETIDVSNLPSGSYIFHIQTADHKKLIKRVIK